MTEEAKKPDEEGKPDFRKMVEGKEVPIPRDDVPPEVALGSKKAEKPMVALDPDKGKYEPKMYKRDGNYPSHGTIHITLFPHKEFEITFEGNITGTDIGRAYRTMRRGYRLWKASQSKTMKQVTAEAEQKKMEVA